MSDKKLPKLPIEPAAQPERLNDLTEKDVDEISDVDLSNAYPKVVYFDLDGNAITPTKLSDNIKARLCHGHKPFDKEETAPFWPSGMGNLILVDPETGEFINHNSPNLEIDIKRQYPEFYTVQNDPEENKILRQLNGIEDSDSTEQVKESSSVAAAFTNPSAEEISEKAIAEYEAKKKLILDSFNSIPREEFPTDEEGNIPDILISDTHFKRRLSGDYLSGLNFAPELSTPELSDLHRPLLSEGLTRRLGLIAGDLDADTFNVTSPYSTVKLGKWFFYRSHPFHGIHHKRRRAGCADEITFTLQQLGWKEHKEQLHKKKYHIFDKTKRAKAERAALKRAKKESAKILHFS